MNPLQLAISLHWDGGDAAAARFPEAERLLDHWLGQLEPFDPIFAPEYLEAPRSSASASSKSRVTPLA